MITKIVFRNFQNHRKTVVELDPHVTCFVGPSDTGKSALVRGLRWVCLNKPRGKSFLRKGAKQGYVQLIIDGHNIIRRQSKHGGGVYYLDGEEYRAFNRDVPDDIAKLLNVSEINFQRQHDAPFWFALTAGQVSRELNQIIDLSIIDKTLAAAAAQVKRARVVAEVSTDRALTAKRELAELDWVPDCNRRLTHIEDLQTVANRAATAVARLGVLVEGVRNHTTAQDRAIRATTAATTVLKVGRQAKAVGKQVQDLTELVGLIRKAKRSAGVTIPDTAKVDQLFREVRSVQADRRRLVQLVTEARKEERMQKQFTSKADRLEEELHQQTKGRCPLCGQKTKSLPSSVRTST